jgi:hypothetical protein
MPSEDGQKCRLVKRFDLPSGLGSQHNLPISRRATRGEVAMGWKEATVMAPSAGSSSRPPPLGN